MRSLSAQCPPDHTIHQPVGQSRFLSTCTSIRRDTSNMPAVRLLLPPGSARNSAEDMSVTSSASTLPTTYLRSTTWPSYLATLPWGNLLRSGGLRADRTAHIAVCGDARTSAKPKLFLRLPDGAEDFVHLWAIRGFRLRHLDRQLGKEREPLGHRKRKLTVFTQIVQNRCALHQRGHRRKKLREDKAKGIHVGCCVDRSPTELFGTCIGWCPDGCILGTAAWPRSAWQWRRRRCKPTDITIFSKHLGETEIAQPHCLALAAGKEHI